MQVLPNNSNKNEPDSNPVLIPFESKKTFSFPKECEEKFANRYTEKDTEYARVCKTLTTGCVPPLVPYKPRNNDYNSDRRDHHRGDRGHDRRDHRGDYHHHQRHY